jgi:hypothetical protein
LENYLSLSYPKLSLISSVTNPSDPRHTGALIKRGAGTVSGKHDTEHVDKTVRAGGYTAYKAALRLVAVRCAAAHRTAGREGTFGNEVAATSPIDELQAARRRIQEREAAPAAAHMDYCLERAFLDIACRRLGMSTEELRGWYESRPYDEAAVR